MTHRQQGIAALPHLPLLISHPWSDDDDEDDEPTLLCISSTVCVTHGAPWILCTEATLIPRRCRHVLRFSTVGHRCDRSWITWLVKRSGDAARQAWTRTGWVCVCVCGIGVCVCSCWDDDDSTNIMWSRLWTKSGPAGLAARRINCWQRGRWGDGCVGVYVCVCLCVCIGGVFRLSHPYWQESDLVTVARYMRYALSLFCT